MERSGAVILGQAIPTSKAPPSPSAGSGAGASGSGGCSPLEIHSASPTSLTPSPSAPPPPPFGSPAVVGGQANGTGKERTGGERAPGRGGLNMGTLLPELICEFLSFAGEAETIMNAALVCRRWERCISSHSILTALRQLSPKKVCLKPRSGGEEIEWFPSISDAVSVAEDDREVWIGAGVYSESLQFTKNVTLRNLGEVHEVTIDVPATSFLDIKDGTPVFRDLTLGSDNGREFSCILVSGGSPSFVGCDMQMLYLLGGNDIRVKGCQIQHLSIQNEGTSFIDRNMFPGSRFAAICVTGQNTFPTLTGNLIRSGELMAVLLENCKGAKLQDNIICNVKQCGVEAFEAAQLTLTNNHIRDCGSYGVYVRSNSFAVVSNNDIAGCKSAAVCFDHSKAFIMENRIQDVHSSAIHAYYCPKGNICGNTIERTGHSSVILDGCSNVNFSQNTVTSNEALAVLIIKGNDVVVEQNRISSSGSNMVIENSSPLVSRNTISKGSIGVLVYGNSKPLVELNEVTEHEDAGVDILVGSSPVLRRNRIRQNGGSGVAISEVINFVDRCDFPDKSRDSLVKNGLPLLLNNTIQENTLMAVNSKGFMLAESGNSYFGNKNYVPSGIARCVEMGKCTYVETQDDYVPQYWHPSVEDRNVGICATCFRNGHFEVMGKRREFLSIGVLSRFYCDCDCSTPKHPEGSCRGQDAPCDMEALGMGEIEHHPSVSSAPFPGGDYPLPPSSSHTTPSPPSHSPVPPGSAPPSLSHTPPPSPPPSLMPPAHPSATTPGAPHLPITIPIIPPQFLEGQGMGYSLMDEEGSMGPYEVDGENLIGEGATSGGTFLSLPTPPDTPNQQQPQQALPQLSLTLSGLALATLDDFLAHPSTPPPMVGYEEAEGEETGDCSGEAQPLCDCGDHCRGCNSAPETPYTAPSTPGMSSCVSSFPSTPQGSSVVSSQESPANSLPSVWGSPAGQNFTELTLGTPPSHATYLMNASPLDLAIAQSYLDASPRASEQGQASEEGEGEAVGPSVALFHSDE